MVLGMPMKAGRGARQQAAQDVEAAVAADADQPVEPQLARPVDHLARTVLHAAVLHRKGEGIAAVGAAEEGAALARQRRVEPAGIEGDRPRPAVRAGRACRSGCRPWSSRSRDGRAAPRRGSWRSARRSRRRWSGCRFAWSCSASTPSLANGRDSEETTDLRHQEAAPAAVSRPATSRPCTSSTAMPTISATGASIPAPTSTPRAE